MNTNTDPSNSAPDIQEMRRALIETFPHTREVRGAVLGSFFRKHFPTIDLKLAYGGLKNFVSEFFPSEIVVCGRSGLDNVFRLAFRLDADSRDLAWQECDTAPSAKFWSEVTHPDTAVQFAWSATGASLWQSRPGTPLDPDLTLVQKLSRADYRDIALAFVETLVWADPEERKEAVDKTDSNLKFTGLMKQRRLVAAWEQFRVSRVIQVFGSRISAAGAHDHLVTDWTTKLKRSHEESRRLRTRPSETALGRAGERLTKANDELSTRQLAKLVFEFASDAELEELRLPLRAMIQAINHLRSGN